MPIAATPVTVAGRWLPERRTLAPWLVVILLEVTLVAAYFGFTDATPTGELRYLLYPFVWINVGLAGALAVDVQTPDRRIRALAATLAVAYFLLVMYLPGNLDVGTLGTAFDARVGMYSPGWGPLLVVSGPIRLVLVPFEVVGYAALSYVVYANLLVAARGALSGLLGLATCVGCSVPVLASLVGLFGGAATGLASTAYAWAYDIGTLLFVATVVLLAWSQRRAMR